MLFTPEFFTYLVGSGDDPLFSTSISFSERFDVVRFDNDADFECKRLVCFACETLNPQTASTRRIPNFNFNIRDDATGRNLFNGFVSTGQLFGDGTVPFVLPTSHFFKRGSKAQMLYDPVDPGPDFDAMTVWLGLVGAKHFEKG